MKPHVVAIFDSRQLILPYFVEPGVGELDADERLVLELLPPASKKKVKGIKTGDLINSIARIQYSFFFQNSF